MKTHFQLFVMAACRLTMLRQHLCFSESVCYCSYMNKKEIPGI
ncbi:hypothetical protein [uncultured Sphaerochaeta sp.]|nr:hypothetical protein [uncultured Sphaerochaeta sp.]